MSTDLLWPRNNHIKIQPYIRDIVWEDYDMHVSPTTERLLFIFEIYAADLSSGNGLL
jgi:hypothetical protein